MPVDAEGAVSIIQQIETFGPMGILAVVLALFVWLFMKERSNLAGERQARTEDYKERAETEKENQKVLISLTHAIEKIGDKIRV